VSKVPAESASCSDRCAFVRFCLPENLNKRRGNPPLFFLFGVLDIRIVKSAAFCDMDLWLIDIVCFRREKDVLSEEDPHDHEDKDEEDPAVIDKLPDPLPCYCELFDRIPASIGIHVILP
jgi:hypothetical protein